MSNIVYLGLSRYARLSALVAGLTVVTPIVILLQLSISSPALLLAIFIYIALFDLFIDHQLPSITWMVIWLVLFAIYTAALLYRPEVSAMSLFSCAFLMLILVVSALFLLSRFVPGNFLPALGKPSLRNRIQVLFVLLTLFTFAAVGAVTMSFFRHNVPNGEQLLFTFIDRLVNIYAFFITNHWGNCNRNR